MLVAQITFLLEIDKLKTIKRKTMVACDNNRQENSAEHSWHVALMAQTLQQYADPQVDIMRATIMLLLHDLVEIDAGDTFAFDQHVDMQVQSAEELIAAKRLFGLLPAPMADDFLQLWQEFEAAETLDAQFAKSMDRLLPLLQNMANHGGTWAQHGVSYQQAAERNRYLQTCAPKLWQYAEQQLALAVQKGWLIQP
ncbi:MAG: HD domain-containing protein [Ferrimonas sp.]